MAGSEKTSDLGEGWTWYNLATGLEILRPNQIVSQAPWYCPKCSDYNMSLIWNYVILRCPRINQISHIAERAVWDWRRIYVQWPFFMAFFLKFHTQVPSKDEGREREKRKPWLITELLRTNLWTEQTPRYIKSIILAEKKTQSTQLSILEHARTTSVL